ncbi:MAG: response regulator transcription factor [Bacteroidales bacterium]
MKILVVEDEYKVASFLKEGLEENHFEVKTVYDGISAEKIAGTDTFDLFVLDIILPDISGFELCRRFKKSYPDIPVLILTARGTTNDKLTGFDAGADDYLVKPFEFAELLARIKVLLRKSGKIQTSPQILSVADLELDLDRKIARRGNKEIELTAREFSLLEYFMRNRGRVLSRNDIAEHVWDASFDFGTNVVDVYVNFLRKKIDRGFDKKLIHTKMGFGYFLDDK